MPNGRNANCNKDNRHYEPNGSGGLRVELKMKHGGKRIAHYFAGAFSKNEAGENSEHRDAELQPVLQCGMHCGAGVVT